MFDENTYENLIDDMLNNVGSDVDTREGSILHETIAPIALELEQVYADLGLVLDECFGDTASYYYLVKRCAERGIYPKESFPAILKIVGVPYTVTIPLGTRFSIGELTYAITEDKGVENNVHSYLLTCEQGGTEGNNTTDAIIPLEEVEGLQSVEFVEIESSGTDDEDAESLRTRYFESFQEVAFGGNQADYRERAKSFRDIYACKVIPHWNGGGSVKLLVLGANYIHATSQVISALQEWIDPTQDGNGVGIAPIGHVVTVATVIDTAVNVTATMAYETGVTWNDVEADFNSKMDEYLLELRKTWENSETLIVRVGEIERILLSLTGVDNVTNIAINGTAGNCTFASTTVPIRGAFNG